MKIIILLLLIFFFLFQGISSAEFYKWEDENGNLHITDYPPPSKSVKNVQVHKYEQKSHKIHLPAVDTPQAETKMPAPPGTGEKQKNTKVAPPETKVKPRKIQNVVLYTTSWCPSCKKAIAYLQSRNIPFTEYDVEKDSAAAARRKQLDPRNGVPFAVINGERILGFSPGAYERALR